MQLAMASATVTVVDVFVFISAGISALLVPLLLFLLARERRHERRLHDEVERLRSTATANKRTLQSNDSRTGPSPTLTAPPDLVSAMAEGRCVLFAGCGLSAEVGLPSWREIAAEVAAELAQHDPTDDWAHLRDKVEPTDLVAVATARLPRSQLADTIVRLYRPGAVSKRQPPQWLQRLTQMPFSAVVTTAWDDVLERLFADRHPLLVNPTDPRQIQAAARSERLVLIKLLGDVTIPTSIIWSIHELGRYAGPSPEISRYVGSLLATSDIVFAGLTPREVDETLDIFGVRRTEGRNRLFGLFGPTADSTELLLLNVKYGLSPLTYRTEDEANSLIRSLEFRTHRRSPKRTPVPQTVERLVLDNIGPFGHVDISLNPSWTVLLGDNGVGKTTVLRALAFALSGSDASDEDAQRLLKVHAKSARISVTIGGVVYPVELVRDRGVVRFSSDKVTPVQSGELLALGFPSLRGVTMRPVPGPREVAEVQGGDPDDLSALRNGRVDERLDNVRQWLVNVAARARSGPTEHALAAKNQLDLVFLLLGKLMPGLNIQYGGLDTEKWEVMVQNAGETVPVDMLSQGVQATLTWAGTLIRRLSSTYEMPTNKAAQHSAALGKGLLLVDELDLHLHPEWQRRIVRAIRETFPNLQVVATTHSPLLVGAMESHEVVQLSRTASTGVVAIPQPSYRGWRADQILTSEAFGLETTRDEATESLVSEYEALLSLPEPTEEQSLRREEVAAQLQAAIPRAGETTHERSVSGVVDRILVDQLSQLSPERRAALTDDALRYLRRIESG